MRVWPVWISTQDRGKILASPIGIPLSKTMQKGEILSARTVFYLPGFMSNHGFQIRLSAQTGSGIYQYINDIL
jgi:hypothetical protein